MPETGDNFQDPSDEYFMRRCLALGQTARSQGDAPVGSLVVCGGRIIAEGVESVKLKNDPTAHAELLAVRAACRQLQTLDLSNCVLYTNVEPCWMCSYAIRQTTLGGVFFGSRNDKIGGVSSKFAVLLDENLKMPKPLIKSGILLEECRRISAL